VERVIDIEYILNQLHLIAPQKYWLCYSTKLIHTVSADNKTPLYDQYIKKALRIGVQAERNNVFETKGTLERCLEIKEKLGLIYQIFLNDQRIIDILRSYRKQIIKFVPSIDEVGDVKLLDSLLWAIGKLELE